MAAAVRIALVVALFAGAWSIYRRLPQDDAGGFGIHRRASATMLRVRLGNVQVPEAKKIPVQLYPINVDALWREFDSERRPGVRFEDFMTRRMGDRQPLAGETDERGEAVIAVPPGRWWVHATLPGAVELSWRMPVQVAGNEQSVTLTPENAYTRTKRF